MANTPNASRQVDDDVARGCRRIAGSVVVLWIVLGAISRLGGNGQIFGEVLLPILVFGAVGFAVARARYVRRKRGATSNQQSATPRTPPRLLPPTRPAAPASPVAVQPVPQPRPPQRAKPAPVAEPRTLEHPVTAAPSSLEEALEDLGIDPSDIGDAPADSALEAPKPKSSQELIDDARRKWGAGRQLE